VCGAQHEHDDRGDQTGCEHDPARRLPYGRHERGADGAPTDRLGQLRVARRQRVGEPVGPQLASGGCGGGEREQRLEHPPVLGQRLVGAALDTSGAAVGERRREREHRHDEHRRVDEREQHDDADRPQRLTEQADELARRAGERAPATGERVQSGEQLRPLEVLERRQRRRDAHDPQAEREARLVGEQRAAAARDHRQQPAQCEQHGDERRPERDSSAGARERAVDHHLQADGVDDRTDRGHDREHERQPCGRRCGAEAGPDEHAGEPPRPAHDGAPPAAKRSACRRNISA
jgi:hypothetical protein